MYTLIEEVELNIENRPQAVLFGIEYHPKLRDYFVTALTETGFDLCNSSYGYFKYSNNIVNTRLRSEASRLQDMHDVLQGYIQAARNIEGDIILTSRKLVADIRNNTAYVLKSGIHFFDACNIHSLESGLYLSWYPHDVFTEGKVQLLAYRTPEGQLKFKAQDAKLYDLDKLQALRDGDRFQKRDYAFFNYDEVKRLLGETTEVIESMSGLFKQGA